MHFNYIIVILRQVAGLCSTMSFHAFALTILGANVELFYLDTLIFSAFLLSIPLLNRKRVEVETTHPGCRQSSVRPLPQSVNCCWKPGLT